MDTQTAPHPNRRRKTRLSDDTAYLLPMATFLGILAVGSHWKSLYSSMYTLRTVVVAALLWALRGHFTRIRWNGWWLGILVGILGIFQWVYMQLWLQAHFKHFAPPPPSDIFDPIKAYPAATAFWSFVAMRVIGAVIVVPFMEELFWRDYLWRFTIAPNNFKLAAVGEWDVKAFLVVSGAFALVHGHWWLTSIGWAMMVGALLAYTRSLGACIIAHGVTNLLLAGYVLWTHDWSFW
jgi:CAAX prenyl protease-like protein